MNQYRLPRITQSNWRIGLVETQKTNGVRCTFLNSGSTPIFCDPTLNPLDWKCTQTIYENPINKLVWSGVDILLPNPETIQDSGKGQTPNIQTECRKSFRVSRSDKYLESGDNDLGDIQTYVNPTDLRSGSPGRMVDTLVPDPSTIETWWWNKDVAFTVRNETT